MTLGPSAESGRRETAGPSRLLLGVGLVLALAIGAMAVLSDDDGGCGQPLPGVRSTVCLDEPASRPAAPTEAWPVLGEDAEIGLDAFAGEVVVVNFWASWCGPCRREQPELNEAAADLADLGVSFLGVNVQDDSETNALAHAREYEIPYPSIDDPAARYAATFRGVGPRTLPSTVFIDRQGRIAASLLGETDRDEVVSLARTLAEESA